MIYSVFNVDSAQYDYYRADGPRFGERAPLVPPHKGAGVNVEVALPALPPSAVRVGAGPAARGILAASPMSFGAVAPVTAAPSESTQWLYLGLYLMGGLLAVNLLLKLAKKM